MEAAIAHVLDVPRRDAADELRFQGRIEEFLNRAFVHRFRYDDAFHDALAADSPGNGTRIDAIEAGDVVCHNKGRQFAFVLPVARFFTEFADDEAGSIGPVGLFDFVEQTVVTDERVGHGNDLTGIGRIGKRFLIACHARIEDNFADSWFIHQHIAIKFLSVL